MGGVVPAADRGVLCYGCNTKLGAIESPVYAKLLAYREYWAAVGKKTE